MNDDVTNSGAAKIKNTCEKYLFMKDQCSPLNNREVTDVHNTRPLGHHIIVVYLTLVDNITVPVRLS
jgi:hypothetical protein